MASVFFWKYLQTSTALTLALETSERLLEMWCDGLEGAVLDFRSEDSAGGGKSTEVGKLNSAYVVGLPAEADRGFQGLEPAGCNIRSSKRQKALEAVPQFIIFQFAPCLCNDWQLCCTTGLEEPKDALETEFEGDIIRISCRYAISINIGIFPDRCDKKHKWQ